MTPETLICRTLLFTVAEASQVPWLCETVNKRKQGQDVQKLKLCEAGTKRNQAGTKPVCCKKQALRPLEPSGTKRNQARNQAKVQHLLCKTATFGIHPVSLLSY